MGISSRDVDPRRLDRRPSHVVHLRLLTASGRVRRVSRWSGHIQEPQSGRRFLRADAPHSAFDLCALSLADLDATAIRGMAVLDFAGS
jgi:hypothetical protein